MRVGIYDPYLDTLGGGEKYILSVASYLSDKADVFVFWDDPTVIQKAKERFNLNLTNIKITNNIFKTKSLFNKYFETQGYDAIFYISDGSIPLLFSKKNILIFQFPVNWINGKSLLNILKFKKINDVICYSEFVKLHLDKTFGISSIIIPPAIDLPGIKNFKKENYILTVGRFTKGGNEKKQEVMIDTFKKMVDDGLKNWKLIVIGSRLDKDKDFVDNLKQKSTNYPIIILDNVSFNDLLEYYKKAKIYWHAAGFGEDVEKNPEKAEHFGMTTLEAMAMGATPIVINAGGQKEIVQDEKSGFLWSDTEDLIIKTKSLIKDEKLWRKISKAAIERSKDYNQGMFQKRIDKLIA